MTKTVSIKGSPIYQEGEASTTVKPGMLVELKSTGEYGPHATAKGYAAPLFALENEIYAGEGPESPDLDDTYADGDLMLMGYFRAGDEVNALLTYGSAVATIVIGDFLESTGDGTLRKMTAHAQSGTTPFAVTTEGKAIAVALEASDQSGGSANTRLKVRIL
jgi:hypothetical protein